MISVIIPVYNVAQYLPSCLDSVLRQTVRDIEVILVNDGSTDESGEICNDYACRDARVSVLHRQNEGPSAARNAAIQMATGDQIAFIDSDDVIHRQYLELLLQTMLQTGADIVQLPYQIVPPDRRPQYDAARLSRPLPKQYPMHQLTGEEALVSMLYQDGRVNSSPCKLFRRPLLDEIRFPVIYRVYEDLYFNAMVCQLSQRVVCIDVPLYYYFKQSGGTLSSLSIQRPDVFLLLDNLEQQYLVQSRKDWVRAVRERRLSASFHILRLLSRLPHTDANKAMAHRCWTHIRQLRAESIHDPKARLKNRLTALASYLIYR